MSEITDSPDRSNHLADQHDNDAIDSEEPVIITECDRTENTNDEMTETERTPTATHPTNETSFIEATPVEAPSGAPRSSVARILVKPGQIFRVQVDNEVKEVHGKFVR